MSENRSLDEIFSEKPPLIERRWFRGLLAGIFLLAFGALIVLLPTAGEREAARRAERASAAPVASPVTDRREAAIGNLPRQPTLEEITEWYRVHQPLYDRIVRVTGEAAEGDPEAERLAALMRERTYLAQIHPGGVTYAMYQAKSSEDAKRLISSTAMVLATRREIGNFPHPPDSAFTFSRGDLNFVDAWEYADWYLGVLVIHELSHWDDIVVSGRESPDARQFTDAWTDGELRAHAIENRLLDRHTVGRFSETLRIVLRDERLSATASGGVPYRVPTEEGWALAMSAFGDAPRSEKEEGMRGGSLMAAFLMLQVGESGPEARAAYNWMLRTGGT